jgi:putative flippase GtrA
VQGLAALANAGGLAIAVELLGLDELVAELVVLPPLVLVTYAVNRSWTFRPR